MTLNDELRVQCEARCGRTVGAVLLEARAHVGGGWVEPLSLDAAGKLCDASDEGLTRFCVADAVAVASRFDAELSTFATTALLDAAPADFAAWLEDPRRTQAEVVQLFGRALARVKARESR